MSSDKEASVKLTLKGGGFSKGMKAMQGEARGTGESMGKALGGGMSSGFEGGLKHMKSGLSSLKNSAMSLGGLVGAIGFADLIKRSVETQGQFRKLAFSFKASGSEAMKWSDIQKQVEATAMRAGIGSKELSAALQSVYDATGNADFATKSLDTIADSANGAHESLDVMANIAGSLNEKFGIGTEDLKDSLASVISLGNQGGLSVNDLADSLGKMGASAKLAGIHGKEGLQRILGLANLADDATGNLKQSVGGVGSLVEGLASGQFQKSAKANLGMDIGAMQKKGSSFEQVLTEMVKRSGGNTGKLASVVGEGPGLKVLTSLADKFNAGGKGDSGVAAVQTALKTASESTLKWSDVQKEASSEAESAQANFTRAMEALEQAFRKPEMIHAIDDLAKNMPKLAEGMGKMLDFVTKHPGESVALAGLAKFGPDLMKGLLASLGGGGGGGAAPALGGGGGIKGMNIQAAGATIAVAGAVYMAGKLIIDDFINDKLERETKRVTDTLDSGNIRNMAKASVDHEGGGGTEEELVEAEKKARSEMARLQKISTDDDAEAELAKTDYSVWMKREMQGGKLSDKDRASNDTQMADYKDAIRMFDIRKQGGWAASANKGSPTDMFNPNDPGAQLGKLVRPKPGALNVGRAEGQIDTSSKEVTAALLGVRSRLDGQLRVTVVNVNDLKQAPRPPDIP